MKFADRLEFDGETVTIGGVEPLGYDVDMDTDSIKGVNVSMGVVTIEATSGRYAVFGANLETIKRIEYSLKRFETDVNWKLFLKQRLGCVPGP